jgi:hypothetical protein
MSFGLNTNQMVTGDESGEQVSNIFITGNPFPFTNYYWSDLGTEQEKYLDYAGCKNAAAVKAGTTIRYILADANMQVLQLRFGKNAIDKLQVGDEIVLKEGLPLAYSDSDSGARADRYGGAFGLHLPYTDARRNGQQPLLGSTARYGDLHFAYDLFAPPLQM